MSRLIEQPPVPEDLPAEVITEGFLTYEIDFDTEGIPQIGEEPAELEEVAVVGRHDAEIVVAVFAIVSTGPGSEEVHLSHPVGFGDGLHYSAELLYRVLSHLVHDSEMAFALYKRGSGPDRSPLPITSHAQYLQQA